MSEIIKRASASSRHFFHVVSNVRPIIWILLYLVLIPIFALFYYWLPAGEFRIPEGGGTNFGSWLYYSIVTITTLGFGDYTPMAPGSQAITALEVVCGLSVFGLFLNAVGAMKSEIDVNAEIEKQRMLHEANEHDKLIANIPALLHNINSYLAYCYALTTPLDDRKKGETRYNADFNLRDMRDMFRPSGLSVDHSGLPVVERLLRSASHLSLTLDSLQSRVDLSLWPDILRDSFEFVAAYQMFSSEDTLCKRIESESCRPEQKLTPYAEKMTKLIASLKDDSTPGAAKEIIGENDILTPIEELYYFVKKTASIAIELETSCSEIALASHSATIRE